MITGEGKQKYEKNSEGERESAQSIESHASNGQRQLRGGN